MATGSGLDAQIAFGTESAYGTPATVTRFLEFNSESLAFVPSWVESTGIRPGVKFKRASRVRQSRKSVAGDVNLDIATLGMGMLVKHMLGSSVTNTTLISGTAYKQIHTYGDFRGLGLTCQVGRPEPSTGTVRAFTYSGLKVQSWEFSLEDESTPNLNLSFDGRSESTATALATYTPLAGSAIFSWDQATIKLGGTATTSAGETTISGGTALATVTRSVSVRQESPKDTERFGIGNSGLKSEPLENDIPTLSGSLTAEFSKTELYDPFQANTTQPLQIDLTGAAIGGSNYLFSIILPAVKIKNATPTVTGPGIVQMSTDFEVYSDETNPAIQIKIVSTESTVV